MAILPQGRSALSSAGRTRILTESSTRLPRGRGSPTKERSAVRTKAATTIPTAAPRPSLPGKLWGKYTEALLARPLLVKGSTASLIFMGSDTVTQRLSSEDGAGWSWDASRALSGAGFGVAATVYLHYWWGFLEVAVNRRLPVSAGGANKLANALAKVAVDQLISAPFYIYSYYCVTHFGKEWASRNNIGRIDDRNHENEETANEATATTAPPTATALMKETSDRAWRMLPDTLRRHWSIWPIFHTFNFYFNPVHHRVLMQNLGLIFWSGYLSYLNNDEGAGQGSGSSLMTPAGEIETTVEIKRKETARLQQIQQRQRRTTESQAERR